MNVVLRSVWDLFLDPLLRRPKRLQVGALCHREAGEGREYLLITSRDTGRWIIPKGWPIPGLSAKEAALQEAWEEAGVRYSDATGEPIGSYTFQKRRTRGLVFPVETLVFSVAVEDLSKTYPEAAQRTRRWVSADDAANMVHEPELKSIFRGL